MPIVVSVKVQAGETVEVVWRLRDGSTHYERYTVPPPAVIERRRLERLPSDFHAGES